MLETVQVGVNNSVLKVHSPFGRVPGGDKPEKRYVADTHSNHSRSKEQCLEFVTALSSGYYSIPVQVNDHLFCSEIVRRKGT